MQPPLAISPAQARVQSDLGTPLCPPAYPLTQEAENTAWGWADFGAGCLLRALLILVA